MLRQLGAELTNLIDRNDKYKDQTGKETKYPTYKL